MNYIIPLFFTGIYCFISIVLFQEPFLFLDFVQVYFLSVLLWEKI